MKPADRLADQKPYFFSALGKKIVKLRSEGVDVIRLDMGSPDLPPADFIIDALVQAAHNPANHGYTLGSGTHKFREAAANFYSRRFGVELDPSSQVIDLIGSKEGLFIISQVLLNPGDIALVPDPGYGVYSSGAKIAGAEIHPMPLLSDNDFLPDLSIIPEEVAEKAKILWLNYPNNPTGGIATLEFFAEVVEFARKYDIIVAHDAPYADVTFDGYRAPSILQISGATDVAVEFNSFSKTYNMAGWRLGMALGQPDVLKYIESYKSQKDSAIFAPILEAGVQALTGDQEWTDERNGIYKQRRDVVAAALSQAGIEANLPKAALYIWAPLPSGVDGFEFCDKMLEETGVSVTPGAVFGEHGKGYFRISLVTPTARIEEAMQRVTKWLKVRDVA